MLFKKKKYVSSEWFQGLLDAEDAYKNGGWSLSGLAAGLRGCTEYEDGVFDYGEYQARILRMESEKWMILSNLSCTTEDS